jgi:hypothetical protein
MAGPAEGDPANEVIDVDATIAKSATFLVRLGNLAFKSDDSFKPGNEI